MGDVSEIPERTWKALGVSSSDVGANRVENGLPSPAPTPTRGTSPNDPPHLPVFVVDALWPLRSHASHFSLFQAMSAALKLKPDVTYTIGSTHPTTHFMWEEVCRSFNRKDGKRDHPDSEISRGLVDRVRQSREFYGKDQLGPKWEEWGGRIEPGWDGLVLEIEDDGQWHEVEAAGMMGI